MPSTPGREVVPSPIGGLCRIFLDGRAVVGVLTTNGIVATTLASPLEALAHGAIDDVKLVRARTSAAPIDPESALFLPPVEARTLLYCGRNYEDHLAEHPRPRQVTPVFFSKLVSSMLGHGRPILVSPEQDVDYEGELAAVIGVRARWVPAGDALRFVAGFTIVNDVTDRAVQRVNNQITMGKGPDTFGPIGPYLVPRSQVGDGSGLRLRTWVGDELRQDGSTDGLIHDVAACVEAATRTVTLEPGDVIATGTPAGVGAYRDPPAFLRPGDVVTVAIDRLGTLSNSVLADPGRPT